LNNARIIARTFLVTVTVIVTLVAVTACSTVRLAYNQAPNLAYWWLDGYADLNGAQTTQVRQDIDRFMDWHRSNELPLYTTVLQQWQSLAPQDITPVQACSQFETVRGALQRAGERSLEPLTRLALSMSEPQQKYLQRQQAKSRDKFEKEFLRGSPEQRLNRRLDKTTDRFETFYGRLSPAQREQLRRDLQASPFDAQKSLQERLRQQAELRQHIAALQVAYPSMAGFTSPGPALDSSRQVMSRLLQSPTPGYAAYSESMVRHSCEMFARLHNSTTPEQRAHAVRVLQDYEADLRVLTVQR
jgi:hypothetical protein